MSPVTLILDRRYVWVRGADTRTLKLLDTISSYKVAGYQWSPAWQARKWDGRKHLFVYRRRPVEGYRAPRGLLEDFIELFEARRIPYTLKYARERDPHPRPRMTWDDSIRLRPYQRDAVKAITDPGLFCCRGILDLPIRSGKTVTAGRIIYEAGLRTLFIVPNQTLLYQTWREFEALLGTDVGLVGDTGWLVRPITVATVQTLLARRGGMRTVKDDRGRKKRVRVKPHPDYVRILDFFDLIIFDECHHLTGKDWHEVVLDFDVVGRIGLSATAHLDHDTENEKGVIWLKAICGNVRHQVGVSDLIEEGYLMRPTIEVYRCTEPDLTGVGWHGGRDGLINAAIFKNPHRNRLLADIAHDYVRLRGLKTLMVTGRIPQTSTLTKLLERRGLRTAAVTGRTAGRDRKRIFDRFARGDLDVLIGTIFGEGVDIPVIEAVINAEGGSDEKATKQRMRNLTVAEGKTECVFADIMDLTSPYVAAHSRARLEYYRSEPAFRFKVIT